MIDYSPDKFAGVLNQVDSVPRRRALEEARREQADATARMKAEVTAMEATWDKGRSVEVSEKDDLDDP